MNSFYRTHSALGGAMALALAASASRAPAETTGVRRPSGRETVTKARQQGKTEGLGGMTGKQIA